MLVWGVNKFLKKGMGLEIGVLILVQKGHTLETLKIGYYGKLRNLFVKMYFIHFN